MAIAFQPEWTDSERIADACIVSYGGLGATARPVGLASLLDGPVSLSVGALLCAVVADPRTVEIVIDKLAPHADLRDAIEGLVGQDWTVSVLVPLDALGVTHTLLRGAPCNLQPWWYDDGQVMFGAYELP